MCIALAANALQLMDACKKTKERIYQPYMVAMLGGISLNPFTVWSASDQILKSVGTITIIHAFTENQY